MPHSPAYAQLVADFGRRFIAAKTARERADARADLDAELILLRTFGPREAEGAHVVDADARRLLMARFGNRAR